MTPAVNNEPLLKTDAVAESLGVGVPALEKWRQLGTGPNYIKVGRLVRYKQSAVDVWLAQRTVATDQKSGVRSNKRKSNDDTRIG